MFVCVCACVQVHLCVHMCVRYYVSTVPQRDLKFISRAHYLASNAIFLSSAWPETCIFARMTESNYKHYTQAPGAISEFASKILMNTL